MPTSARPLIKRKRPAPQPEARPVTYCSIKRVRPRKGKRDPRTFPPRATAQSLGMMLYIEAYYRANALGDPWVYLKKP